MSTDRFDCRDTTIEKETISITKQINIVPILGKHIDDSKDEFCLFVESKCGQFL